MKLFFKNILIEKRLKTKDRRLKLKNQGPKPETRSTKFYTDFGNLVFRLRSDLV